MIPKKIHYTWFSKDPFPQDIKDCMETWKIFLPEYEWVLWDSEKIKDIENVFLKEALQQKKWAFAADFVRLYAVYSEGGIYMDTDVKLYKNFNDFLNYQCFIGRENSFHKTGMSYVSYLGSHCFGAVKGSRFIKECLDYYTGRNFVLSHNNSLPEELRFDMKLLPYIQAVLAKPYGFDAQYRNNTMLKNPELHIFPSWYFDASSVSEETVCQHLAAGSWRKKQSEVVEKLSLSYKIEWRIIKLIDDMLRKFHYMVVKF